MALSDRGFLTTAICVGACVAAIAFGLLVYRNGPTITSEVCAVCGLFRSRTVWRVPQTPLDVIWRSQFTTSAVSIAILENKLVSEWHHRWIVYGETRPIPPPAPKASSGRKTSVLAISLVPKPTPQAHSGTRLIYQYNSPDVARWMVALHALSDRKTFAKWMRWLGDTNLSPHILGTAIRYRIEREQLTERSNLEAWLKDEEEKLVFGRRPRED